MRSSTITQERASITTVATKIRSVVSVISPKSRETSSSIWFLLLHIGFITAMITWFRWVSFKWKPRSRNSRKDERHEEKNENKRERNKRWNGQVISRGVQLSQIEHCLLSKKVKVEPYDHMHSVCMGNGLVWLEHRIFIHYEYVHDGQLMFATILFTNPGRKGICYKFAPTLATVGQIESCARAFSELPNLRIFEVRELRIFVPYT